MRTPRLAMARAMANVTEMAGTKAAPPSSASRTSRVTKALMQASQSLRMHSSPFDQQHSVVRVSDDRQVRLATGSGVVLDGAGSAQTGAYEHRVCVDFAACERIDRRRRGSAVSMRPDPKPRNVATAQNSRMRRASARIFVEAVLGRRVAHRN